MFIHLSHDGPSKELRRSQWRRYAHPQGQFVWQRMSLPGIGIRCVEADVCDRKTIFKRASSPHSLPITFIVLWTVSNGRWQSTAAVVQRSAQFLNWIRKVRQRGKGIGFWTNLAAHKNNLPPHTPMGYI